VKISVVKINGSLTIRGQVWHYLRQRRGVLGDQDARRGDRLGPRGVRLLQFTNAALTASITCT
jgi:hypothetical protein